MKIVVIGDMDDAIGFSLAGIREVYYVPPEDEEHLKRLVKSLAVRPDVAIVIMTPELYAKVRDMVAEFMREKPFPVFLDIPREGVLKSLEDLVSKALGIRIEFKKRRR